MQSTQFLLAPGLAAALLVGIGTLSPVNAQELVINGGFETGDFTGWTQFGNTGFTGVVNGAFGGVNPPEGSFQAFFGPVGSTGGIQQTIATTPGGLYNIFFDLHNFGGTPSAYSVDFGSTNLVSVSNPSAFNYTPFNYQVAATSNSTALSFAFQNNPSYFLLDAVSVQAAVPEPGSVALLVGMASAGSILVRRTRRKKA